METTEAITLVLYINNVQPPKIVKSSNPICATQRTNNFRIIPESGVQDPDFGVQSSQKLGIFLIWIGYRFPFNWILIIQMK